MDSPRRASFDPSSTAFASPSLTVSDTPSSIAQDTAGEIGQSILIVQGNNMLEQPRLNSLRRISLPDTPTSVETLELKECDPPERLSSSRATEVEGPGGSKKTAKRVSHFFGTSFQQSMASSQAGGEEVRRRRSSLPLPVTPRRTPTTPRRSPRASPTGGSCSVKPLDRPAAASSAVQSLPTSEAPRSSDQAPPGSESCGGPQGRPAAASSAVPFFQKAASTSSLFAKMKYPAIPYGVCVKAVLSAKPSDKGYKRIQETLKEYDRIHASMSKSTFGERQRALTPYAVACLTAMLDYQIIFKEKALFEEESKEERSFDPRVESLITHLNNGFRLFIQGNHEETVELLDELSNAKRNIAAAHRAGEGEIETFLDEMSKFIRYACQYEGLRGDRVMLKKARHEMAKYNNKLLNIAKVHPQDIFTAFKNDLLIDLCFSGHDFCEGLHGLTCSYLNTVLASENYRFLDQVQVFLTRLHAARSNWQIGGHLKKMREIYDSFVSNDVVNLSSREKRYIEQNLDLQSAKHKANTLVPKEFFDCAVHLFLGAQIAVKKLVAAQLSNYKKDPQNQDHLMNILLHCIAGPG